MAKLPLIAPYYLTKQADRWRAIASLRLTRRIVAQAPLARCRLEEFRPGA